MAEYKYYFSNTNFLIPETIIGKSSISDAVADQKPKIKKSLSSNAHEVEDNHLFYTEIPGKYHVIVYEFNNIQVTKYKPIYALYYQYCVKSRSSALEFFGHKVVVHAKSPIRYIEFDIQDFFDYNFEFFTIDESKSEYIVEVLSEKQANICNMTIEMDIDIDKSKRLMIWSGDKIIEPNKVVNINQGLLSPTDIGNKSIVCFDKSANVIMIWRSAASTYASGIIDNNQVKFVNNFRLSPWNGIQLDKTIPNYEIVKVFLNNTTIPSPNATTISLEASFKKASHNSKIFGDITIFAGEFEFMIKIHRNIIRNLYDKFLYIDVLDIGIGKCRDVYSYSQYVNRNDIYGVEPNKEFSKHCTIRNVFNSTADDIFKHFKLKKMNKKFHTIVFCNSYNFVTNPYITMKECEEVLDRDGRIIMVYMNNDKVQTVKNQYYEIRKGESDPDLPKGHVLEGRQNFIEVFREVTLVPPHYENQISESDILNALEKVNSELKSKQLELIEKGTLVHPVYSNWLTEEAKLFNSMFYYVVVGRPCKFDKLIIAFDPCTTTLKNYINYLHKKKTFCNGVEIQSFNNYKKDPTKVNVVAVDSFAQYAELKSQNHELLINIQNGPELEYSALYKFDVNKFIEQRQKLLASNIQHSKFGFPERE